MSLPWDRGPGVFVARDLLRVVRFVLTLVVVGRLHVAAVHRDGVVPPSLARLQLNALGPDLKNGARAVAAGRGGRRVGGRDGQLLASPGDGVPVRVVTLASDDFRQDSAPGVDEPIANLNSGNICF